MSLSRPLCASPLLSNSGTSFPLHFFNYARPPPSRRCRLPLASSDQLAAPAHDFRASEWRRRALGHFAALAVLFSLLSNSASLTLPPALPSLLPFYCVLLTVYGRHCRNSLAGARSLSTVFASSHSFHRCERFFRPTTEVSSCWLLHHSLRSYFLVRSVSTPIVRMIPTV